MIDAIGWMLVHAVWEGGLVAAGLAITLWLARGGSSSMRYTLALAALVLAAVAPIVTTVTLGHSPVNSTHAIARQPIPATRLLPTTTSAASGTSASLTSSAAALPRRQLLDRVSARIDGLLPWFVGAWLVGVGLLSLRVVGGVAMVRRLGGRGLAAVDETTHVIATRLASRLGIRRMVRVVQSFSVDVPMVVGWLRPAVVVPVGLFASVAPAQLEMLLAHELAHVRRYDTIVNLAQTIIETLLFYHPAVWWISARVREERENCCDDLAITATGTDRRDYGAMLLLLEESRSTARLAAAATDGSLVRRVRRIILGPPTRVELGATWLAGIATMLIVFVVILPSRVPAIAAVAPHQQAAAPIARVPDTITTQPKPSASSHPLTRSPSMNRSSLVAGVVALAVATTPAATHAQSINGRWIAVGRAVTIPADSAAGKSSGFGYQDSGGSNAIVIEQTDGTVSIANDSPIQDGKIVFTIEATDGASVRVKGPVGISVNGIQIKIDSPSDDPGVVHLEWAGNEIKFDASKYMKGVARFGSLTFTPDGADELLIRVDVPANDKSPASSTIQRFRRG